MNQFSRTIAADAKVRPISLPGLTPERADDHLTPAGLQDVRDLTRRRITVLALNLVTLGFLSWLLWMAFAAGGWSTSDIIIFGCFLVGAPWTVMGMWNAVIGIWLLQMPSTKAS